MAFQPFFKMNQFFQGGPPQAPRPPAANPYDYTPDQEDLKQIRNQSLLTLGGSMLSSLDANAPGGVNWGGLGQGILQTQQTMMGMHNQLAEKNAQEALWKQSQDERVEDNIHRSAQLGVAQGGLKLREDDLEFRQQEALRESTQETLDTRRELIGAKRGLQEMVTTGKIDQREYDRLGIILDNSGPKGMWKEIEMSSREDKSGGAGGPQPTFQFIQDQDNMTAWYFDTRGHFPEGTVQRNMLDDLYGTKDWTGLKSLSRDVEFKQYNALPPINKDLNATLVRQSIDEGNKYFTRVLYGEAEKVFRENIALELEKKLEESKSWSTMVGEGIQGAKKKINAKKLLGLKLDISPSEAQQKILDYRNADIPLAELSKLKEEEFRVGEDPDNPQTVYDRISQYVEKGQISMEASTTARNAANKHQTQMYTKSRDDMNDSNALRRTEMEEIREDLQISLPDLSLVQQGLHNTHNLTGDMTQTLNNGTISLFMALQKRGQVPQGLPDEVMAQNPQIKQELDEYMIRIWGMTLGRELSTAGY